VGLRAAVETLILDTHALVWLLAADRRVSARCRAQCASAVAAGELFVCSISFWEIARLARRGRIEVPSPIDAWRARIIGLGIRDVPLDARMAILADGLVDFHADPADRFIASTAITMGATLVTADDLILNWGGALKRSDLRG
jgi:PIN domain nuclease of toxin-antitoxin system